MYILKPSFAGGELTPALYGRTDLAKYDVGAAKIENMIVLRYGGVSRRPGFRYIENAGGRARLIPFRYNTAENYVVVITAGLTRFIYQGEMVKNGADVYSVSNPFSESDLDDIKYTQSADVLFICHPNHHPMTLTRYSHTNWKLATMDIKPAPFDDSNTTEITITPSAVSGTITLTASASYFNAGMVGRLMRLGHTVGSQYAKGNPKSQTLQVSCPPGGSVYVESFGFWSGTFTLQVYDKNAAGWVDVRSQNGNHSQNYNFTETNRDTEITKYRVVSSDFDTTFWPNENERQVGCVTIQTFAKDYYGVVKITGVTSGTRATATVITELGATKATQDFALSAWSTENGYPRCACFFEDRLVFAGNKKQPQTYWASKTGDYFNFGESIPSADDDAITSTLSNGQMNTIRALIPFGELILLTAGSEYKLSGSNGAWSPSNQDVKVQEYRGINNLTPVVVGSHIVYVQHQGSIVRDLAYSYDADKYTGDDVSLLASHLFDGKFIRAITYQQTPNSLVWCVRDDGVLLCMTYIKEQDVYAWSRHNTDGEFIDVCSIAGTTEDNLYAVVKRGDDFFIEMLANEIQPDEVEKQYFVDCGVEISGTGLKEVTGLTWLEGKEVAILADGNVMPAQTVTDGKITLPTSGRGFSRVIVGLPYKSQLVTLPIEFQARDGTFESRKKRIITLMINFHKSRSGMFGAVDKVLDEIKWRSIENYGEPIKLITEKKSIVIQAGTYEETIAANIVQEDPLPQTIVSIVPEVIPGG